MLNGECTTDALPASSHRKNDSRKDNKKEPKVKESKSEEERHTNCPFAQPSVSQSCVNISGSHIHVGHRIYFGVKTKQAEKPIVKETKKMISLKNSCAPVTCKDIGVLSEHMSSGWEDTARHLGYSLGQIQAFENCHLRNLKQAKYDLLKDWIENNGPDRATVGILARTLWMKDQKEALKLWSEEYDKIHSNDSDDAYF